MEEAAEAACYSQSQFILAIRCLTPCAAQKLFYQWSLVALLPANCSQIKACHDNRSEQLVARTHESA